MNLNWFLSRTVRHAVQMRKHVWKILAAQRDVLTPPAIDAVNRALQSLDAATRRKLDTPALEQEMGNLEKIANKWLKPYPFPAWRENIDVLVVAIAVALGIRTFFLQPFKIPTGSMQPTLYGITSNPDLKNPHRYLNPQRPTPDFEVPNPVSRFLTFWFRGVSYTHIVAKGDGSVQAVEKPKRFLLFNLWQRFQVGDHWYTVWFPVDDLLARAGLITPSNQASPRVFRAGEDLIKIKVVSGDHLFVDRLSYNFRRPRRGDIIVFQTAGVYHSMVPQDQYYIKRLVALGGERVQVGTDRHLVIDGKRLDAATPGFENVYSFTNGYSGHAPAELFADGREMRIRPNYCLVMGDNTENSLDSRYFGDFSRDYVIGKSFFVYWPIGAQDGRASRFGWGHTSSSVR